MFLFLVRRVRPLAVSTDRWQATPPRNLRGHAISAAVEDSGINPANIDEILLGCVVGAGTPYRFDGQPFDRDASPCTPDNGRQVEG